MKLQHLTEISSARKHCGAFDYMKEEVVSLSLNGYSKNSCPKKAASRIVKLSAKLSAASVAVLLGSVDPAFAGSECGLAAYYDQGSVTANGEPFDPNALTAAHPWLPMGSWVTVVDQDTGASVDVRINDRGPWDGERILDMTPAVINIIDPNQTADVRNVCIHW